MTDKTSCCGTSTPATAMPAPVIASLDDCCGGGSCAGEPIVKPEPVVAAAQDDCCGGGSCAGEPIVKPEPVAAAAQDDCCGGGSCAGPAIEQAPATASGQPGLWSRLMAAINPGRSA